MKYKRVTVCWFDAASKSEWHALEENGGLMLVHTSGWLVRETEQLITVCNSYTEDGSLGDCISIPRPWIERIDHE